MAQACRLVDPPKGFPFKLEDSQWEKLRDQNVLDVKLGNDGRVIRLFAKDALGRAGKIAYFSHIDVNGSNYGFTALCENLEKKSPASKRGSEPSPHARGTLGIRAEFLFQSRTIPACAGYTSPCRPRPIL